MLVAYRDLFATENGRIVLKDLIQRFHVFGVTAVLPHFDGTANALRSAQAEGERRVVLTILQNLDTRDEDLLKLHQEMGDDTRGIPRPAEAEMGKADDDG